MDFSGRNYPEDLTLQFVHLYLRYRDMEETPVERDVEIDHTTPNHWVQEYAPQLATEQSRYLNTC